MDILQYRQTDIVPKKVQTILYFFQVGFENINSMVGKKVSSLGIYCGDNAKIFTQGNYFSDQRFS